jgi:hypothetical protein
MAKVPSCFILARVWLLLHISRKDSHSLMVRLYCSCSSLMVVAIVTPCNNTGKANSKKRRFPSGDDKKKVTQSRGVQGAEFLIIPHRECAMDGRPFCCCTWRGTRTTADPLSGMTTRKARATATIGATTKASRHLLSRAFPPRRRFLRAGFYLGMRVKLWMETFAPPRARSFAERKTMVISSNR